MLLVQGPNGWLLCQDDFSGELMHVARYARRTGRALAIAGCVALASFAAPAAFAQDPPGNNGTVKVDGEPFETTPPPPPNQPHPDDCVFQIDFYGFDAGNLNATVNFTGQAPTGKNIPLLTDTVTLEDDPAGGGIDLDGQETYDLSSVIGLLGDPQPEQGYHIKLQVDVPDGTHSTAYSKYKVFWVEDCRPTQPSTPPPTTPTTRPPEPPKPSVETSAPVPTAVPAGTDAAGGGSGAGLFGLALIASGAVAGTAVIARRRFLHDS